MALKIKVKIDGVSNLHEARYCAGMGVDFLGITLDQKSDSYINLEDFKTLKNWLSGSYFVGELNGITSPLNDNLIQNYGFDYIETDFKGYTNIISQKKLPLFYNYAYNPKKDKQLILKELQIHQKYVHYFFLRGTMPLNPLLIETLAFVSQHLPIFLGFNIKKENLDLILKNIKPVGLILPGSTELKTGLNDFDELANILEALEIED